MVIKLLRRLLRKEGENADLLQDFEASWERQRKEDAARLRARTEADRRRNMYPPKYVQWNQPDHRPPKK